MKEYIPQTFDNPKVVNVVSAWYEIPTILKDIITRFSIPTDNALEFGVERGYSTTALAYYFKNVIGVDIFHPRKDFNLEDVQELLKDYKNIQLFRSSFEDYIKTEDRDFDLIHIDIIHQYKPTYDCGDWACMHSNCVIFHDTESFTDVKTAVGNLAIKHNMEFYNYTKNNGLGILIRKQ